MGLLGTIAGGLVGGIPGAIAGSNFGGDGGVDGWLFGNNDARNRLLNDPNLTKLQGAPELRNYAYNQMLGAQGRGAPTASAAQLGAASQLANGPQDQWRQQQMALAGQLNGVASGQQMGAGEMAVRRQAAQQAAQLAGQTNMARGSNAGIMARAAARGLGGLGVNAAGMAGQQALQDQAAARGQLSGLLGQGREMDIGLAGQNAQLAQQQMLQQGMFNQQANLANQQAALQQRGINDQYGLGMLGAYSNMSAEELRARLGMLGALPQDNGHIGALLQTGGQIAAAGAMPGAK